MFDCVIISVLIFLFFLSTLLVHVARHRVSFSGHVDSIYMRAWTDDQIDGDLL